MFGLILEWKRFVFLHYSKVNLGFTMALLKILPRFELSNKDDRFRKRPDNI